MHEKTADTAHSTTAMHPTSLAAQRKEIGELLGSNAYTGLRIYELYISTEVQEHDASTKE